MASSSSEVKQPAKRRKQNNLHPGIQAPTDGAVKPMGRNHGDGLRQTTLGDFIRPKEKHPGISKEKGVYPGFSKEKNVHPGFSKEKSVHPGFSITEVNGDLFDSEDSLAHCVSADFCMGKGIAKTFVENFKEVRQLRNGTEKGKIGTAVAVQHGDRYIFNLVTKEKYNGRPLISSVRKSLESMKEQCNESAVTNLSIPKIGAGLDRLDWGEVKQTVEEVFCDTDIQIVVHVYKPR